MTTGKAGAELAALQARVEQIATELFAAREWTGPAPLVRVDPRVSRLSRAVAGTRAGRGLIRVSPSVAAEPFDFLRGTLSHEAGHLVIAHRRRAHTGWALTVGVPLWALAIACCVIGVQNSSTQQTSLWFGAALVLALVALRLIVIPSRRCEIAADRWSAALIGVDAVLGTLEHLDAQSAPLARLAAAAGMDSHPSPRQRARRILRGRPGADTACR